MSQDSLDVTVRRRTILDDLEEFVGGDELFALEDSLDGFDGFGRQLGKVGQSSVLDLAPLAVSLAEQDSGW